VSGQCANAVQTRIESNNLWRNKTQHD